MAKKTDLDREKQKLRRELADRFSPSNAQVEESSAAAAIEGDDESPADAKERERHSERQRNAKHEVPRSPGETGHIDIEA